MAMTADQLPDDPDALKAMVLARDVENARLIQIIKELQRHRFGRRAETLPEDQLLLGLEEAEQIEAAGEEEAEQASSAQRQAKTAKRRANRGAMPPHLPRVEMVVDIDDHACPCCRNGLHRIGEDVSERLDIVPAQLRVIVVRRPKYASHGDYMVKCDFPPLHGPRSEPDHVTRPGRRASSTSHAVAAPGGSTNIPLAAGAGSGRR
ncbi:IS66 family transposase zinc-finger binding domain-containing protein, partial [Mesorhizobium sp. M0296]|uniref:IS66 family transposase zinc-finger binding domain-containing protein n=1 Tax=Mesorhizobium sp. M0296 TaxID=2956931 RepID=UPI0033385C99